MQLEATGKPIKYRLLSGEEVILRPGVPVELPQEAALVLLKKAAGKVRIAESFQVGLTITWEGADLTIRTGVVDFVHTDAAGVLWAFVTMPNGGWAAVNGKYAKVMAGT